MVKLILVRPTGCVGGGANPRINGGVFVTVRGVVVRDHQDVRHRFLVSHCDWTVSPL